MKTTISRSATEKSSNLQNRPTPNQTMVLSIGTIAFGEFGLIAGNDDRDRKRRGLP